MTWYFCITNRANVSNRDRLWFCRSKFVTSEKMSCQQRSRFLWLKSRMKPLVEQKRERGRGKLWISPASRMKTQFVKSGALQNDVIRFSIAFGSPCCYWQRASLSPAAMAMAANLLKHTKLVQTLDPLQSLDHCLGCFSSCAGLRGLSGRFGLIWLLPATAVGGRAGENRWGYFIRDIKMLVLSINPSLSHLSFSFKTIGKVRPLLCPGNRAYRG